MNGHKVLIWCLMKGRVAHIQVNFIHFLDPVLFLTRSKTLCDLCQQQDPHLLFMSFDRNLCQNVCLYLYPSLFLSFVVLLCVHLLLDTSSTVVSTIFTLYMEKYIFYPLISVSQDWMWSLDCLEDKRKIANSLKRCNEDWYTMWAMNR